MRGKRSERRADHFQVAEEHWRGMPEYFSDNLHAFKSLTVKFASQAGREEFSKLIGQPITEQSRYLWHPKVESISTVDTAYVDDPNEIPAKPAYPIYIISKGRSQTRFTMDSLEKMEVQYYAVVEPQEKWEYARFIDPKKILVLPFSNLGQGSIPARNFVWEHAISLGVERHWILDDNLNEFYRLNHNMKIRAHTGAIFAAAEDFVDRYENVALAGFHYLMFAKRRDMLPPFYLNARVYSCILIKNDLPYRWRGRYNEDTDLSLRALKDGWCTVLFATFLANKIATMSMKGGNTDELYKDDGRLKMAQSLVDQHPDVVRVAQKFGRWQHQVDYRGFGKNKLRLKVGGVVPDGVNNYGMLLQAHDKGLEIDKLVASVNSPDAKPFSINREKIDESLEELFDEG